jgi:hypothetical protein
MLLFTKKGHPKAADLLGLIWVVIFFRYRDCKLDSMELGDLGTDRTLKASAEDIGQVGHLPGCSWKILIPSCLHHNQDKDG